jgi:CBS domain-containing protein
MMSECDCGSIPVVEDSNSMRAIGVITDRDIVVRVIASGQDCREATVEQAMTSSVVTTRPDEDILEAEGAMKEHQIRRIVVTDEDGRCVGILAQADIARHRSEMETGDVVEMISEPVGAF